MLFPKKYFDTAVYDRQSPCGELCCKCAGSIDLYCLHHSTHECNKLPNDLPVMNKTKRRQYVTKNLYKR